MVFILDLILLYQVDSYTDVQRQQIGTSTLNNGDHLLVLDTVSENYNVLLSNVPFLAGLIQLI